MTQHMTPNTPKIVVNTILGSFSNDLMAFSCQNAGHDKNQFRKLWGNILVKNKTHNPEFRFAYSEMVRTKGPETLPLACHPVAKVWPMANHCPMAGQAMANCSPLGNYWRMVGQYRLASIWPMVAQWLAIFVEALWSFSVSTFSLLVVLVLF